jgi:putative flippase GtrA
MITSERKQDLKQFIFYAFIGLGGASIDYVLYALLVHLDVHYLLANAISTCAGILFSFFVNLNYNFKSTDHLRYRFISFFTVGLLGLFLSTVLLKAFIHTLGMDPLIAKLATLVFILLFQYTLNRNITFGNIMFFINWIKNNKFLVLATAILAVSYAIPLITHSVVDEYDNFVGGKHIIEFGSWPYHDFFSHHMILPYLFSAVFYLFAGENAYYLRLCFYALSAAIILFNAVLLGKYAGKVSSISFILLFAVGIMFLGMGRFLSENLATLFLVTSVNLLMYIVLAKKQLALWHVALISALLTMTALTTLNYIYVIGVVGIFTLYLMAREYLGSKNIKQSLARLVVLGSAPVIALVLLAGTHTLRPMAKDAILFNTETYSKYAPALGSGPIDTFFGSIGANIQFIVDVIREPLSQTGPFSLLLCVTVIFAIVVLRKNAALLTALLAAVLLANTRTDDGVNEPTLYHMVLMRMLILLLVAFLIPHAIRIYQEKKQTGHTHILKLALVVLFAWSIVGYTLSSITVTAKGVREYSLPDPTPGRMASLRDAERKSKAAAAEMQAVVDRDPQHAGYFVGPLNFGPELKMSTKQATRYTFWLPWSADCRRCTKEFIAQMNENKPSVILWESNFVIMDTNTDEHTPEFMDFIRKNYYLEKTYPDNRGNNKLYIRNDLRGIDAKED